MLSAVSIEQIQPEVGAAAIVDQTFIEGNPSHAKLFRTAMRFWATLTDIERIMVFVIHFKRFGCFDPTTGMTVCFGCGEPLWTHSPAGKH